MLRSLNHKKFNRKPFFIFSKNNKVNATGDKIRKEIIIIVVDNKNWKNKYKDITVNIN